MLPFAGFSYNENIFHKADSLYAADEFAKAAVQYELAGFLHPDPTMLAHALLKKADCLKQLYQYHSAYLALQRINLALLPDSLLGEVLYHSSLLAFLGRQFPEAEQNLQKLEYYSKDSTVIHRATPLYVLVLDEQKKWKEAEEKLMRYIVASDLDSLRKDSLIEQVKAAFDERLYPEFKRLNKAKTLSTFLPGTGQWYAGSFKSGAINAGLELSALALTGYLIYVKYFVTAVIAGYGLFQRFYVGGQNGMDYLVDKKNYELLRDYNGGLKNLVLMVAAEVSGPVN